MARTVLVAGASGLVGFAAAQHFTRLPGWKVTIKARQFGFHDCMDTEDMFRKWFRRFQERRWLPPPA